MSNVITIVAKIRAAKGKGDALAAAARRAAAAVRQANPAAWCIGRTARRRIAICFLFYETYQDQAAMTPTRKGAHLAAFRERVEREGAEPRGAVESSEIYRSLTRLNRRGAVGTAKRGSRGDDMVAGMVGTSRRMCRDRWAPPRRLPGAW